MKTSLTLFIFFVTLNVWAQSNNENVFLITLDGLRWQELFQGADSSLVGDKDYVKNIQELKSNFWKDDLIARRRALMPFFWEVIAENGQLFGNRNFQSKVNCTNQQWFSYPGYSEILCGFADDQRITSNDKIPNPNVTVLEFLNQQDQLKGKIAAFGSWDVFPYIVNEGRSGVPVNAGFEAIQQPDLNERERLLNSLQKQIPSPWSTVRFDGLTYHIAKEYIKRNSPRVVYIAFGETDDFAHDGHYDAYLKSARQTDAFIKDLWDYAQSHPQYKDHTTLVITTDHGRGTLPKDTWRSHGTKINGADEIWIAILGPQLSTTGEMKIKEQLYQNQIAATVANILGFKYQPNDQVGAPIPLK